MIKSRKITKEVFTFQDDLNLRQLDAMIKARLAWEEMDRLRELLKKAGRSLRKEHA